MPRHGARGQYHNGQLSARVYPRPPSLRQASGGKLPPLSHLEGAGDVRGEVHVPNPRRRGQFRGVERQVYSSPHEGE